MATIDEILAQQGAEVVNDGAAVKPAAQENSNTTAPSSVTPSADASGMVAVPGGVAGDKVQDVGHLSYAEMVQQLSPYKPPTKEEVAQERRRQKRDQVFAALGDGFAAFNVAYSNARGTKPVTALGLTGRVRDRYERLKREREANQMQYLNAYLNATKADDALKQQSVTNALANRRQDRMDRETKIKEDKAAAYQQYQAAVTAKNDEQAAYWRAKWEALEAGKDAEVALKEARAAQARASARLNNVRADAGGFSSAARGVGGYTVETTKTDKYGNTTTEKKVRTPGAAGGDGEGKRRPNPMGSNSATSKKKKNPML